MDVSTVETQPGSDRVWRWSVRILYTTLIAAELWILADWWASTPSGQITIARWGDRIAELKRKAEECEGCAKRRALLTKATNRMFWDATRIVEGEDVETEPEP